MLQETLQKFQIIYHPRKIPLAIDKGKTFLYQKTKGNFLKVLSHFPFHWAPPAVKIVTPYSPPLTSHTQWDCFLISAFEHLQYYHVDSSY